MCYHTGAIVGEGTNPKLELLQWASSRLAFTSKPICAPDVTLPLFSLSPGTNPTKMETQPRLLSLSEAYQNQRGFRVAPQLPRIAQPIIPLVYGTRKGWPFYAEFLFAWEEHGNGEACQLGVSISCTSQAVEERQAAVQLKFSPSAGAMFQQRQEGSFRMWPLEDLWVDASLPGTQTFLEAGVYIDADGQVAFYRKGPYTGKDKGEVARQLSWEVAGGFRCVSEIGAAAEDFHVVLCLLDEHTGLEAKLVKIGSTPPIAPVVTQRRNWVPETQVR